MVKKTQRNDFFFCWA